LVRGGRHKKTLENFETKETAIRKGWEKKCEDWKIETNNVYGHRTGQESQDAEIPKAHDGFDADEGQSN